jgi:hypothetical protein
MSAGLWVCCVRGEVWRLEKGGVSRVINEIRVREWQSACGRRTRGNLSRARSLSSSRTRLLQRALSLSCARVLSLSHARALALSLSRARARSLSSGENFLSDSP